jgi:hypothetical protein
MSIIRADLQALCIAGLGIHIICNKINDLTMISNSFTISFHDIFDERCQNFDNEVIGKGGLQNYYPSSKLSDVGLLVEVFLNKHSRYLLRH